MPETRAQFLLYALMGLVASPAEELLFADSCSGPSQSMGACRSPRCFPRSFSVSDMSYQGWLAEILRTAFIGIVFAIGFVLTRSLWWLMLAHIAVNLLGGLFVWRVIRLSPTD